MLQHYVEFIYPGLIVSNRSTHIIQDRNHLIVERQDNSFGFRFFDKEEVIVEGEKLRGVQKNTSVWYYYHGDVYTIDQVKEEFEHEKILISNMFNNSIERVLRTKFGQFIPLTNEDIVLSKEVA